MLLQLFLDWSYWKVFSSYLSPYTKIWQRMQRHFSSDFDMWCELLWMEQMFQCKLYDHYWFAFSAVLETMCWKIHRFKNCSQRYVTVYRGTTIKGIVTAVTTDRNLIGTKMLCACSFSIYLVLCFLMANSIGYLIDL